MGEATTNRCKGTHVCEVLPEGTKSSISKFYTEEQLQKLAAEIGAETHDAVFILTGEKDKVLKQLGDLRLEIARRMELIQPGVFRPLWVLDFPLLEWDDEAQRFLPCTTRLPVPYRRIWS